VETETFAALTASGRSLERRRRLAEVRRRGLTRPTTTVLRGGNRRAKASGNVWRNWGYLAGLRQARETRRCQPTGRWRSERYNLAQFAADSRSGQLVDSDRAKLLKTSLCIFRFAVNPRVFEIENWRPECAIAEFPKSDPSTPPHPRPPK
jgi:hypothetical protein